MDTSEAAAEAQLRTHIESLLAAAGAELTGTRLHVFPMPSHPGYHLLIAPDDLEEWIVRIAPQAHLESLREHRGVWLHVPVEITPSAASTNQKDCQHAAPASAAASSGTQMRRLQA